MFLRRRVPENGPLKAAVIGAGAFGRHHAAKYSAMEGVSLFAIADPSPEVRRDAAARHAGVLAVADWRELLGKVDLVSICSPAISHYEVVRAFLNAGAHVLVEKPIATTRE
ncbi:MAG TPA: Gfo/Idh/MocA family oxidoreductase, partial [Rhizomicrobium sp.]